VTRVACALLLFLGLTALYAASRLTFGAARQPETGFFPTIVALALVLFSALAVAERPEALAPIEKGGAARAWIVVGATAAYAILVQPVGFLVATTALLLLLLRGIGKVSWTYSIMGSVVAALVCYELFTRLGMPLPAGLLPL
jgi:putative tricarboxylic transport membrane protein